MRRVSSVVDRRIVVEDVHVAFRTQVEIAGLILQGAKRLATCGHHDNVAGMQGSVKGSKI